MVILIVFKIEMYDGMGYVAGNDEKSIRIFTSAYQLQQAFSQ